MLTNEDANYLVGCEIVVAWDEDEIETFEIVDDGDCQISGNKVHYNSEFAKSLINKKAGDTVDYVVNGHKNSYKLIGVKSQLERCIEDRNLTKLYHFTPTENLESILKHGILSKKFLNKNKIDFIENDSLRFDYKEDYINCSLEYPNNKLLWRFRYSHERSYCLIEIDINILKDNLFSLCSSSNAARSSGEYIKPISRINHLFGGVRSNNIPNNYTTDPQAEILIKDKILPKYFKRIIFYNHNEYIRVKNLIPAQIKAVVDFKLFSVRSD